MSVRSKSSGRTKFQQKGVSRNGMKSKLLLLLSSCILLEFLFLIVSMCLSCNVKIIPLEM